MLKYHLLITIWFTVFSLDCSAVECGPLPLGEFLRPVELDYKLTYQSEVDLACITGYESKDSAMAVRCLKTGLWTPPPACQSKTCFSNEVFKNSVMI